MPKILCLVSLLLCCFLPAIASGNPVPHHGTVVESVASSRECLACHDGSMATAVSTCLNGRCPLGGPHPVDVPYPPPGSSSEYRSTPGVRLLNGQVVCISCHNLENPRPGHPIVDFATTNICLMCHIK